MLDFDVIYQETDWLSLFNESFNSVVGAIDKYYTHKDLVEKSKIQNIFGEENGELVNQLFPNSQFEGNVFEVLGQEVKNAFQNGGIDSARAVLDGSKNKLRIVADGLSVNLTRQSALKFNNVINDAMGSIDHGFNQMVSAFNASQAVKENSNMFAKGFQNAVDAKTQKQWLDFAEEKNISKSNINRAIENKFVKSVMQGDREGLKSLSEATDNQKMLLEGNKALDVADKRKQAQQALNNKSVVNSIASSFFSNPNSPEFQEANNLLTSVVSKNDKQSGLDVIFDDNAGSQIDFGDVSVDSLKDWNTVAGFNYNKKAFQNAVNKLEADDTSNEAMALRSANKLVHSFITPDDIKKFRNNVTSATPDYQVQSDPKFQDSQGEFDENKVNQELNDDTLYSDIVNKCVKQFGLEGMKISDEVVQKCVSGVSPVDVAIGEVVRTKIEDGNHVIANSDGSSNIVDRNSMQGLINDAKSFVGKVSPSEIVDGGNKKHSLSREYLDSFIPNNVTADNVAFLGNYKKVILASSLNHIKIPDSSKNVNDVDAEARLIDLLKNPNREGIEITKDNKGNPDIQIDGKGLAEYLYPDQFKAKEKIGRKNNVSSSSSSSNNNEYPSSDDGEKGLKPKKK